MALDPLTGFSLGIKGISLISSIFGGKKSSDRAEEQAAREAEIERKVTAERVRQIGVEKEALRGETVARTAASGIKTTSQSSLELLKEQAFEFQMEELITREVGASKAKASLDRGSALAEQYRQSGYQGALSSLGSIFSVLSENKRSTGSPWRVTGKE